jgi:hypothetical protein
LAPKISYLFSKNTSWDIFYELQSKKQIRSWKHYYKKKLNGEVSFTPNKFEK